MKGKGVKDLKSFPLLPFLICSNATSKKYSGIALSGVILYFIFFHNNSVLASYPWSGGNGST